MLQERSQYALIVSQVPVIQNGLEYIIHTHFPEIKLSHCRSSEALTTIQLYQPDFVVVDLSGDQESARLAYQQFYSLLSTHAKRCIFLIPPEIYPVAAELLMRPGCTLLSTAESMEGIIQAIRDDSEKVSMVSRALSAPVWQQDNIKEIRRIKLTLSERQVLRLLGKGWSINQISAMLKKSNKTISAQKNSAMRRLALRSNAEMYAWINSMQGMRELNLLAMKKRDDGISPGELLFS